MTQKTMEPLAIVVRASWDPEAQVWVATSDDVPGLATEAPTQDELVTKLQEMIPELLALNGEGPSREREVPLFIMSEHVAKVRLPAA